MTQNVVTVRADTTVVDTARTMMERRISAVPVVDSDGRLTGIISEGDLMRRVESGTERHPSWWLALFETPEVHALRYVKSHGRLAGEVMTHQVVTVDEDTSLQTIAELLERHRIKRVPVVRDGRMVGIVSRANLLHGLATAKIAERLVDDDHAIRSSIMDALNQEISVQDDFINVTVSAGVVHLWGVVQTEAKRVAIRVVAENTLGVQAIDDHIGILPAQIRFIPLIE
jgi:CBS domain-containing protein